jgi:hypothetical protein
VNHILKKSPIPRLYLSKGEHELRSAITNPTGEWILPETWSPFVRHITVSESNVVLSKEEEEDDKDKKEDKGDDEEEAPVQMEVPIIKVVSPPEMGVITSRMVDMQFEVMFPLKCMVYVCVLERVCDEYVHLVHIFTITSCYCSQNFAFCFVKILIYI